MLSRIPSWAFAIAGPAIVIIATAITSPLLYQTQESIKQGTAEIAEARREVDRLWSNHLLAEQKSTAGDLFFAQVKGGNQNSGFLYRSAAYQLWKAALLMWIAAGEPEPDDTQEKLLSFRRMLTEGDSNGYDILKSEINRLRELSAQYINKQTAEIRNTQARMQSLNVRETRLYLAYLFFNVLGLMVTMCKDLPVWKTERRREHET